MLILIYASVAQLDRAQDSDSWCRGFKSCQTRHVGAKFALLRLFCLLQKICHPLACSSFPQKVTLGSPAQLQAPSQRFAVATNFLRVQIHPQKREEHLFCYLLTKRVLTRFVFGLFFLFLSKYARCN